MANYTMQQALSWSMPARGCPCGAGCGKHVVVAIHADIADRFGMFVRACATARWVVHRGYLICPECWEVLSYMTSEKLSEDIRRYLLSILVVEEPRA